MWNGKKKAVTFSFDDGVRQDFLTVEILNKYGLKGTFNLNSGALGVVQSVDFNGKPICRDKVQPKEVKSLYEGHEVAVHTLLHPNLTELTEDAIVWQVEEDRKLLGSLVGYDIVGMAYPCGGVNNDDRVADVLKRRTKIRYSRTITSSFSFDKQENLLRFNPSACITRKAEANEILERFLAIASDRPQLLYVWGHSYEFDMIPDGWTFFETFCRKIANREEIYYGTNKDVLLKANENNE